MSLFCYAVSLWVPKKGSDPTEKMQIWDLTNQQFLGGDPNKINKYEMIWNLSHVDKDLVSDNFIL